MYGFDNFHKVTFSFINHDVRDKHGFYIDYVEDAEKKLLIERKTIEDAYNEAIKEAASDEHENAIQSHFEELWHNNYEVTPSLIYGSIFLSLFGYLEGTMKQCYDECVVPHGLKYPPIKNSKKYIKDYKGFFNKYGLFDFAPFKDHFKFIEDCEFIRDKFIHTNGELPEDEYEVTKKIFDKYPSIHTRPYRFAMVDKDLVLQLCDTMVEVLGALSKHLETNITRYESASPTLAV